MAWDGWRDRLGISLSLLCMIHCFLTPVLLLLLPLMNTHPSEGMWFWGIEVLSSESWHVIFLLVVPMVALLAFLPGWRHHRDKRIWGFAAIGFFFLGAGVFTGWLGGEAHHKNEMSMQNISALSELILTIIGSTFFIRAHFINRKLLGCQIGEGCCEAHVEETLH